VQIGKNVQFHGDEIIRPMVDFATLIHPTQEH